MIALTRGGLQTGRHPGFFFGNDNPRSDAGLSLEKSAEVIVPEVSRHWWEGLNVRSSFYLDLAGLYHRKPSIPQGSYLPDDSLEDESKAGVLSDVAAPTG